MTDTAPPPGFIRFRVGRATATCAEHVGDAVRAILGRETLYEFAEFHLQARALVGRGVVYAVPLPGGVERVVVRRNHHGGILGGLRGDLFLPPTRAPRELGISEHLRAHGVPAPAMLGYVLYDGPAGLRRADVMTREVPDAVDLSKPLHSGDPVERVRALHATACLVRTLDGVGARHHDLNVKNVLLHHSEDLALEALVLDVDRVTFARNDRDVREQNLARLLRSARKWQAKHGALVTDAELDEFASLVRDPRS